MRRFTRVSRRRRAIALGAGISLAGLVGGVAVVTLSPIMSLTTIEVTGASRLDPQLIVDALDEHLGTPLAFLSDDEIASDLADFTLVRSFATEIVPPNSLIVRIVERAPIGARETPDGVELVDAAGVVVEVSDALPDGVPLIQVPSDDAESAAFGAVADVLIALPREMVSRIRTVSASTRDDVTFELRDSAHVVVWGGAERSAQKTRVLDAAIAATDQAVRWVYDVSAPDSLVVREAG
ncbi:MAG TPA: FtsQ-type POTRA domain-containing protein [Microcella sp.]|nr:FtsQ-type POTRA domain-containing protein [Microcella sp.]